MMHVKLHDDSGEVEIEELSETGLEHAIGLCERFIEELREEAALRFREHACDSTDFVPCDECGSLIPDNNDVACVPPDGGVLCPDCFEKLYPEQV